MTLASVMIHGFTLLFDGLNSVTELCIKDVTTLTRPEAAQNEERAEPRYS